MFSQKNFFFMPLTILFLSLFCCVLKNSKFKDIIPFLVFLCQYCFFYGYYSIFISGTVRNLCLYRRRVRETKRFLSGIHRAVGKSDGWPAAVTDGSLPDYQVAAFLMAVFFKGMDAEETAAAIFLDIMLAAISGILSTVPVTSRRAYSFLSADV